LPRDHCWMTSINHAPKKLTASTRSGPHVCLHAFDELFSRGFGVRLEVPLKRRKFLSHRQHATHRKLTASSHLCNSDNVHVSGSPVGSLSAGNISPPHIFHNAEAVIMPTNPILLAQQRSFFRKGVSYRERGSARQLVENREIRRSGYGKMVPTLD
jgi:hypothetical protein